MNLHKISALAIGSILLGTSALAQVNNNSTTSTGNVSGNAGGAPASLNINFDKLGTFLLTRAHTLNLDGLTMGMPTGTKKKYIAGFSSEGALIYNFELNGETMSSWDDIGRNAGEQILPYSIQILPNGTKKVSFSTFAFRNMNTLQNTEHKFAPNGEGEFWTVVDRLDVLTFSWDQHTSFNNIHSFDFDVINTNLKVGLVKNESKTNYLALRFGGSGGGKITTIDNMPSYGYENTRKMGWNGQFSGGLELNLQSNKGTRVNMQSNYVGGGSQIYVNNLSVVDKNQSNHQDFQTRLNQYNTDHSQYSLNIDAWKAAKASYEQANTGGTPISDESFGVISGQAKPTEPKKPINPKDLNSAQALMRSYGYLKNTVDVSFPLKKSGHPMRLGVGVDVNVAFYDKVVNKNNENYGSAARIDLKGNYNQLLTGRIYLNF